MPLPASVSGPAFEPLSGSRSSDAELPELDRRGGREGESDDNEEEEEGEQEEEEYEEIEVEEEDDIEVDEEEEEADVEEEQESGGDDEDEEEENVDEEEVEELCSREGEESGLQVNPDMDTRGSESHWKSNSTPEKSDPKLENSPVANSKCDQKLCASPSITLMVQKELSEEKDKESGSCKSEKLLISVPENCNLGSAANGKVLETMLIKEIPDELRGPCGSASITLSDCELVAAKPTSSCRIPPQDSNTPLTMRETVDGKSRGDFQFGEEMSMDMDLDEDNELAKKSVTSSGVRPRSQSPTSNLKNGSKRLAMICDFFAKGWCIKGSSCRFRHIKNEVNKPDQELEKDATAAKLMKEDQIGRGRNFLLDDGESQRFQRSGDKYQFSSLQLNDLSSASSAATRSKDDRAVPSEDVRLQTFERNQPLSAHGSCEPPSSRGNSLLKDSGLPYLGFSSGSYVVPGKHQKAYLSNLDDQISRGSQHLRDPLLKASFSGSVSQILPSTGIAGTYLHHPEHKAQISSTDWEPSEPFRPSFFITRTLISSPHVQYDPLQDSFDSPGSRETSFKFSFSFASQGTTALTPDKAHQQVHVEALVAPESNASSFSQVKDNSNEMKIDDSDAGQKSDGARHENRSNLKRSVEMEVEQKTNKDNEKESKVSRHFRASLVEFAKEQMKPHWREGRMTKDVHNQIVKKTVEKVFSSLQSHQIPSTAESTEHYLSISRPKISKLIEGYITKYGRS